MITPKRMAQPCGKSFASAQSQPAPMGLRSDAQLNAASIRSIIQPKPKLRGSKAFTAPTIVRTTARAQSTTNSLFNWSSLTATVSVRGSYGSTTHADLERITVEVSTC